MPVLPRADETRQIEHVQEALQREFSSVPPAVVADQVHEAADGFHDAPVRSFVPVLVQRQVRERLRHLASR